MMVAICCKIFINPCKRGKKMYIQTWVGIKPGSPHETPKMAKIHFKVSDMNTLVDSS